MTALLGWVNYAKASTITANSVGTASLDPANIATDSGSPADAWQTVNGVTTLAAGALIKIVPVITAQTWGSAGLFRTNLTSSAVVNFTLWNAGSPPTAVWSTNVSPVSGYGQVVAVVPNSTADYLQIYINDASNPDGFINVPLLFAGPSWKPARSVGYSSTVGRDISQASVMTRGGQERINLLWRRRRWNIQFDSLGTSEVWGNVDAMQMTAETGSNVLFIPDAASTNIQREAVFGVMKSTADISYPYQYADRRRWSAQVTERL